jgi:hypothetical protein
MGHERNILWAAHSVHHQSEDYNLTTALRQTSTGFLLSWIFYLPWRCSACRWWCSSAWRAEPAVSVLGAYPHIPKLGWFEWFFVTPSNHRAHHAQNALYMDRNYGGVFIIWDRLFGTFQEEDDNEPVIFGVTTPLASWNPLWANLQFYAQLWADARRRRAGGTSCASGSCAPVGGRRMWRPNTRGQAGPEPVPQIRGAAGRTSAGVRLVQFCGYVALGQLLDECGPRLPTAALILGWSAMALGLFALGWPWRIARGRSSRSWCAWRECAAGVAGAAGRAVAGQRVGLAGPAELQPAQRYRPLLLQKPLTRLAS